MEYIAFIALLLAVSALSWVVGALGKAWENWQGPKFRELPRVVGDMNAPPSSPVPEPQWEELEPEEEPQPARFRRWDEAATNAE